MLLSLTGLAARGYAVNAHGCRQLFQALALLAQLKAQGRLPHMVVIALGANGYVTHNDIGVALGLLCCTRELVLVTPRQLGGAPGENAVIEHEEAHRHHGRILLLDWVKDSTGHPSWFQPDGLHLTLSGAAAFTRLLATALPHAYPHPKPQKPHKPRHANADAAAAQPVAPEARLVVHVNRRARAGRTIVIQLRDRAGTGGLPLTVCVTPPGGGESCTPWQLHPGQSRRKIQLPAPRPGGWLVTVQGQGGSEHRATVWVSHPGGRIRLLAAGDSEMQILDGFLGQDLARYGVQVTSDARISTGLTNSFLFNWPAHAAHQAPRLRPDVTVFFMGANEGYSVAGPDGQRVNCCSAAWSAGYANLVAEMMRIYLRDNAGRVYWFLLPAPRPENFREVFNAVNAGISEAAVRFPGRVGLINANAFFTPGNRYRNYMVYHGHGFVIHESDGIHLSTASDAIDATIMVHRLLADRVIR
jgi:lysophospholipase L1-like esterase